MPAGDGITEVEPHDPTGYVMPTTTERALRFLLSLPGRGPDARAAVNGLFGDAFAANGSSLAVPMSFRTANGTDLPLERDRLATLLPEATPRVCVLVHGLMSCESVWGFPGHPDVTYGELLAADRGITPVYVRYNTGRRISANGRELAAMLHELVAQWPVAVRELDLVGHSMGGLVIRSACHYGRGSGALRARVRGRGPWPSKVRRVVLLGTPNTGANLEVIANLTSGLLWSLPNPVTRLIGSGLDRRSEGIKDLRWGSVLDEDWVERDPDATQRPDLHPVRVPRRAEYLVIAGSLADDRDDGVHPVNRVLGDALVTSSSAEGRRDGGDGRPLFPRVTVRRCPRINHVALANRPEVYREIADWW